MFGLVWAATHGSIQTSYNLYELLTYWQMCFQNSGAVSGAFLTDQCEPIYVESAGPRAQGPGPLRERGRLGRASRVPLPLT